jgi:hypothetical protein
MGGWISAHAIGHLAADAVAGIPTEIEVCIGGACQMPRMIGLGVLWQGCVHPRLQTTPYVHKTELHTQDWVVHAHHSKP